MELILTILSVIVTIIIGIIGVKYTFKQRKKTELTFLKNTCIYLFKAIVKNLDGIEIKYQGNKIGENIILFKGTIFNTGNVDIDESIIHKPLSMKLPANYSWIEYKIIDKSDGLEVAVIKEDNKLIFNWELLKESEYFTFDSLIEFNSDEPDKKVQDQDLNDCLIEKISFDHRITSLKSVAKENKIPRPTPLGILIFLILVTLLMIGAGLYLSVGQFLLPKYEIFNAYRIDSTLTYVKVKAIDSSTIKLLNQKDKVVEKISLLEFNKQSINNSVIFKVKTEIVNLVFGSFLVLTYLLLLITIIVIEIQRRKLFNKIKAIAGKYDSNDLRDKSIFRIFLFPKN
jgi:hypothetical protein